MGLNSKKKSLTESHPHLLQEWDSEKNTLGPDDVAPGSHKKVWWLCSKGHSWEAVVKNRAGLGSGCPYCNSKRTLADYNDLATTHPSLVAEWDSKKNKGLLPTQVLPRSNKKVWWKCKKGHSWEAVIATRTRKNPTGCPFCAGQSTLHGYNDLATTYPELVKEWDFEKNTLDPETVAAKSNKKVWWLCSKGHSWEATVNNRSKGKGCPDCAGRRTITGTTDLVTTHPELVKEWDYEKSLLDPTSITYGSGKKAWWKCSNNHSWEARISNRTLNGRGCPYCSGRCAVAGSTDLSTTHPDLAKEWDHEKNTNLSLESVSKGTHSKAWWLCKNGHSWEARVYSRATGGNGCPYCAGQKTIQGVNDFATVHPELLAEWDYEKNTLDPTNLPCSSHSKAWWLCKDGHSWEAVIGGRTRGGNGCPYCSGRAPILGETDLATTHPDLVKEWDYEKNSLTPQDLSAGSDKRVWWLCSKGHSWQVNPCGRVRDNTGCPTCWSKTFVSKAEKELLDFVQNLDPSAVGTYRNLPNVSEVDIYVPSKNIAIEYNGLYWHSEVYKDKNAHYDKWKACKDQGIQLIQIWEDEWLSKPEIVKALLTHKLGLSKEASVYARKTTVVELSNHETAIFFTSNHVQGAGAGSIRLGLRDGSGEVVACAVFRKRSEGVLELVRYATSCRVVGGQGKILKHIQRNYPDIKKIVTFADHCVSDGNLYESLGFVNDGIVPPDYRYIVGRTRAHKFGYRLKKFKSDPDLLWQEGLSERDLAALNGLLRIYDAGKTRYVLDLQ